MFAPFGGPTCLAAHVGIPFSFEESFPSGAARISQSDKNEMEIFVKQYSPVLPGMLFQFGIENGLAPANEGGGGGRIAGGVTKIGAVADSDRRTVKKVWPRCFGHVDFGHVNLQ